MISIKRLIIITYSLITVYILIPFLWDKYMFLLDFFPAMNIHQELDIFYGKDVPIYGTIKFLILINVIDISQKVILFMTLFMSGYSIYILVDSIISSGIARLYLGVLYMINPYTYIKIMTGQLLMLFPYAVFPLLLKVFIDLLEKKENKEMIQFIFLLSIVAFNIHILIISIIIISIIFLFWFNKYKDTRMTKIIIFSSIIFIILNSYWIIPVLTARNTIIDNIEKEDYKVFAPKIDNLSDLFNIVSMYGFWREGYIYAKDFIPYWQLLSIFIILLAIYGFISYYKDDKIGYLVKALGVIGVIGFILATGINGPFGDFNHWLYDNTILKGFRDSHKFVAMMVLAYVVLGGLGVNKINKIIMNEYNG